MTQVRTRYASVAYQIASLLFFAAQAKLNRFNSTEKTFSALDTFIAAGDTVIDVGANVGRYTLKASKLVGAQGLVVSLEPVPRLNCILKNLLMILGIRNVILLQCAAAGSNSLTKVQEIPTSGKKYILNTSTASRLDTIKGEPCLTVTLDEIIPIDVKVHLIKIDVEGNELDVLRGSKKILRRHHPKLIIEFVSGISDPDILEFLDALGYTYSVPPQPDHERNLIASIEKSVVHKNR
jgi:FkbM family methyltransferase